MEVAQNIVPVTTEEGISNTTVVLMLVFFLILAGAGYFFMEKSAPAKASGAGGKAGTPPNPATAKTLPTVAPGAKTSAGGLSGLLTDPSLFKGIMSLSSSIESLVKPAVTASGGKTSGGTPDATADSLSPSGYVDSEGSPVNKDGSDYTGTGKFNNTPPLSTDDNSDLQEGLDATS